MDDRPIDRAAVLVRAYAELLLADLEASGAAPSGAAYSASAAGYSVLVIVTPAGHGQALAGEAAAGRQAGA